MDGRDRPLYDRVMAQTREGAIKVAARKAGTTPEGYLLRVEAGEKWCTNCKGWHATDQFAADASRFDGLTSSCRASRNAKGKAAYQPKERPAKGRSFVPARDGDREQARRRVNYFVEAGIILHPNALPCTDCGHQWSEGERRHEYDHHLGYSAEHHEHVEVVCTTCHGKRTEAA